MMLNKHREILTERWATTDRNQKRLRTERPCVTEDCETVKFSALLGLIMLDSPHICWTMITLPLEYSLCTETLEEMDDEMMVSILPDQNDERRL